MIHILSEQTINQIAAGEVVENPASVVKELVENSLDAGAKQIHIEVRAGGLQLVRVADDGLGMDRQNAQLAVKRHATSKLKTAEDLLSLSSLGFRGEALASIAAISKFSLMTATAAGEGTQIVIDGGETPSAIACARKQGTTVEAHALFYNVPARKKFQKSAPVCASEIFRCVTLFALSHPEVGFELVSNEKKTIDLSPSSLEERIAALLGEDFLSGRRAVRFSCGSFQLHGLLGAPTLSRPNRTGQYLFLNRRAVICPLIQEAIKEAYATRLSMARYPIFVLNVTAPPDLIDVNVHPQKKEVRLREERFFKEKIQEALQQAFAPAKEAFVFEEPLVDYPAVQPTFSLRFEEEKTLALPQEPVFMGLFANYLFLEEEEALRVVDLQAAQRRIAYDALMAPQTKQLVKQGLLVPCTLALSALDAAMVLTHLPAIEAACFALHPVGKNLFMIDAIPPFLEEEAAKEALLEMAQALQTFIGQEGQEGKMREKLAYLAACRAGSEKGYLRQEALLLFKELMRSPLPERCPKGHPTMKQLKKYEIEKLFCR
jgi:DNA mismatch repair protein MutL